MMSEKQLNVYMSQFLWIENITTGTFKTDTENIFGKSLNYPVIPDNVWQIKHLLQDSGIFVTVSFLESLEFIYDPRQLLQIDYVILDLEIPLPLFTEKNPLLVRILTNYYDYQPQPNNQIIDNTNFVAAQERLTPMAGYQLYIELVRELGFPKEHILFCAHDIAKQTSIRSIFELAKVELPLLLAKTDKKQLRQWVQAKQENSYSILRRAIIMGCQYLQAVLQAESQDNIYKLFNSDYDPSLPALTFKDLDDYLATLTNILPLRCPANPQVVYKLFIKQLALKWDGNYTVGNKSYLTTPSHHQYNFNWIKRCAKKWLSQTATFKQFSEQDLGFFFLITMRVMFKLAETTPTYEQMLLKLFHKQFNYSRYQFYPSHSQLRSTLPLSTVDN
jgi:hypothetical protein